MTSVRNTARQPENSLLPLENRTFREKTRTFLLKDLGNQEKAGKKPLENFKNLPENLKNHSANAQKHAENQAPRPTR